MLGNFKELFIENEKPKEVPKAIVDVLNKNKIFPSGFEYKVNGEECILEPITKEDSKRLKFNFKMKLSKEIIEKYKDNFQKYLYCTQTSVVLENFKFIIDDREYDINELIKRPLILNDSLNIMNVLKPQEFPPAKTMKLKLNEKKEYSINFRRQPYNDIDVMLIGNEDFKVLCIKFYINEKTKKCNMKLKLNFEEATSVKQLVEAFELYNGFVTSIVKLNGHKFPKWTINGVSEEDLSEAIKNWTRVTVLEKKLKVKFKPTQDLTELEYEYVQELYTCLINKSPIITYEPFDYFQTGEFTTDKNEELINKKNLSFDFIEEREITLIGCKIQLYIAIRLEDFIITSINKTEDGKKTKINIQSEENKKSMLKQFYFTKKSQAEKYLNIKDDQKTIMD